MACSQFPSQQAINRPTSCGSHKPLTKKKDYQWHCDCFAHSLLDIANAMILNPPRQVQRRLRGQLISRMRSFQLPVGPTSRSPKGLSTIWQCDCFAHSMLHIANAKFLNPSRQVQRRLRAKWISRLVSLDESKSLLSENWLFAMTFLDFDVQSRNVPATCPQFLSQQAINQATC